MIAALRIACWGAEPLLLSARPLRLHSAKILVKGEPNVSYICSRYYRAPELIFGATDYTCCIDTWSAGCVLAELLLGVPLFPGESGVDQLVEIIKVLGTPSLEEIQQMNQNYSEYKFPQVKPHPWTKVFRPRTPTDAIDLVSKFLKYAPDSRLKPLEGCALPLFDELRDQNLKLPNNLPPPPLFDVRCSRKNASENVPLTRCPHRLALPRSDLCVPPVPCARSSRRRSSSSTHPHSKPSSSPHGTARLTCHARTRAKREQCIGERTTAAAALPVRDASGSSAVTGVGETGRLALNTRGRGVLRQQQQRQKRFMLFREPRRLRSPCACLDRGMRRGAAQRDSCAAVGKA